MLYTDSGIYRNRQFSRADAITLQTTYDEVFILWGQELKYRANFSTVNQVVNMPVVYAKVSGVEDGKVEAYWQKIKLLLGDDTMLIPSLPYVVTGAAAGGENAAKRQAEARGNQGRPPISVRSAARRTAGAYV